jgi:hypothetical protein
LEHIFLFYRKSKKLRKTNNELEMKKTSFKQIFFKINFTIFILLLFCLTSFAQEDITSLIEEVQINTQRAYDEINTVSFKGYSKTYIYFGYNPLQVKLIPLMQEYYLDGYWIKPDSLRLIVKAIRTVSLDSSGNKIEDIGPLPNPFRFTYDPSALGIKGEKNESGKEIWPLYPFAKGADSLYKYEKESEVGFGENKVYAIKVEAKDSSVPAVNGIFHIDVNRKVVVGSDYVFNSAASITEGWGAEDHRVKDEKILLYSSYWLPMNLEEEFEVKIWGMKAKIHRIINFDTYQVNPELPDSTLLVSNKKIVYDFDPELEKRLFKDVEFPSRLSKTEQEQIIKTIEDKFAAMDLYKDLLESEEMAREAMRMALGQRVSKYYQLAQRFGNYTLYNRVEGLRLKYGINISNIPLKYSIFSINAGYGFKDKRWKGDFAFLQHLDSERKIFVESNLYNSTSFEESRKIISTGSNTFTSLFYRGDYRDYYYKIGGNFGLGMKVNENLAFKLSYVSQTEESAINHVNFGILDLNQQFRTNPEIIEGELRGIRTAVLFRTYNFDVNLSGEYTDKQTLHSDFSYSFLKGNIRRSFRPTYHSHLHFNIFGGISSGFLTPQRWFDFGGKSFLNYFGNLRGVDYKTFTGDKMAYSTIEYILNGSTFYDLGLKKKWLKAIKLTFWTGVGWSSLSEKSKSLAANLNAPLRTTNGTYHEFGLGIGDILNILRVDLVRNSISKNKLLVSFNVLR